MRTAQVEHLATPYASNEPQKNAVFFALRAALIGTILSVVTPGDQPATLAQEPPKATREQEGPLFPQELDSLTKKLGSPVYAERAVAHKRLQLHLTQHADIDTVQRLLQQQKGAELEQKRRIELLVQDGIDAIHKDTLRVLHDMEYPVLPWAWVPENCEAAKAHQKKIGKIAIGNGYGSYLASHHVAEAVKIHIPNMPPHYEAWRSATASLLDDFIRDEIPKALQSSNPAMHMRQTREKISVLLQQMIDAEEEWRAKQKNPTQYPSLRSRK